MHHSFASSLALLLSLSLHSFVKLPAFVLSLVLEVTSLVLEVTSLVLEVTSLVLEVTSLVLVKPCTSH